MTTEFNDRLLKKFQKYVLLLAIGVIIGIVTNLILMVGHQVQYEAVKLAVISANESATKADLALQQSSFNTREILEHSSVVGYHSNDTKVNGKAILNNTELLLQLHEKIK